METSAVFRDSCETGHVFADRDPCAEQLRVRGPGQIGGVVDVQRVDTDKRRLSPREQLGAFIREEWVLREVRLGPPVTREVGADEDGAAGEIAPPEELRPDRPSPARRVDDDDGNMGETVER